MKIPSGIKKFFGKNSAGSSLNVSLGLGASKTGKRPQFVQGLRRHLAPVQQSFSPEGLFPEGIPPDESEDLLKHAFRAPTQAGRADPKPQSSSLQHRTAKHLGAALGFGRGSERKLVGQFHSPLPPSPDEPAVETQSGQWLKKGLGRLTENALDQQRREHTEQQQQQNLATRVHTLTEANPVSLHRAVEHLDGLNAKVMQLDHAELSLIVGKQTAEEKWQTCKVDHHKAAAAVEKAELTTKNFEGLLSKLEMRKVSACTQAQNSRIALESLDQRIAGLKAQLATLPAARPSSQTSRGPGYEAVLRDRMKVSQDNLPLLEREQLNAKNALDQARRSFVKQLPCTSARRIAKRAMAEAADCSRGATASVKECTDHIAECERELKAIRAERASVDDTTYLRGEIELMLTSLDGERPTLVKNVTLADEYLVGLQGSMISVQTMHHRAKEALIPLVIAAEKAKRFMDEAERSHTLLETDLATLRGQKDQNNQTVRERVNSSLPDAKINADKLRQTAATELNVSIEALVTRPPGFSGHTTTELTEQLRQLATRLDGVPSGLSVEAEAILRKERMPTPQVLELITRSVAQAAGGVAAEGVKVLQDLMARNFAQLVPQPLTDPDGPCIYPFPVSPSPSEQAISLLGNRPSGVEILQRLTRPAAEAPSRELKDALIVHLRASQAHAKLEGKIDLADFRWLARADEAARQTVHGQDLNHQALDPAASAESVQRRLAFHGVRNGFISVAEGSEYDLVNKALTTLATEWFDQAAATGAVPSAASPLRAVGVAARVATDVELQTHEKAASTQLHHACTALKKLVTYDLIALKRAAEADAQPRATGGFDADDPAWSRALVSRFAKSAEKVVAQPSGATGDVAPNDPVRSGELATLAEPAQNGGVDQPTATEDVLLKDLVHAKVLLDYIDKRAQRGERLDQMHLGPWAWRSINRKTQQQYKLASGGSWGGPLQRLRRQKEATPTDSRAAPSAESSGTSNQLVPRSLQSCVPNAFTGKVTKVVDLLASLNEFLCDPYEPRGGSERATGSLLAEGSSNEDGSISSGYVADDDSSVGETPRAAAGEAVPMEPPWLNESPENSPDVKPGTSPRHAHFLEAVKVLFGTDDRSVRALSKVLLDVFPQTEFVDRYEEMINCAKALREQVPTARQAIGVLATSQALRVLTNIESGGGVANANQRAERLMQVDKSAKAQEGIAKFYEKPGKHLSDWANAAGDALEKASDELAKARKLQEDGGATAELMKIWTDAALDNVFASVEMGRGRQMGVGLPGVGGFANKVGNLLGVTARPDVSALRTGENVFQIGRDALGVGFSVGRTTTVDVSLGLQAGVGVPLVVPLVDGGVGLSTAYQRSEARREGGATVRIPRVDKNKNLDVMAESFRQVMQTVVDWNKIEDADHAPRYVSPLEALLCENPAVSVSTIALSTSLTTTRESGVSAFGSVGLPLDQKGSVAGTAVFASVQNKRSHNDTMSRPAGGVQPISADVSRDENNVSATLGASQAFSGRVADSPAGGLRGRIGLVAKTVELKRNMAQAAVSVLGTPDGAIIADRTLEYSSFEKFEAKVAPNRDKWVIRAMQVNKWPEGFPEGDKRLVCEKALDDFLAQARNALRSGTATLQENMDVRPEVGAQLNASLGLAQLARLQGRDEEAKALELAGNAMLQDESSYQPFQMRIKLRSQDGDDKGLNFGLKKLETRTARAQKSHDLYPRLR